MAHNAVRAGVTAFGITAESSSSALAEERDAVPHCPQNTMAQELRFSPDVSLHAAKQRAWCNSGRHVAAMMCCETARLSFEEEMRSVWIITGLLFLGILLLSAIADEPIVSLADTIKSHILVPW